MSPRKRFDFDSQPLGVLPSSVRDEILRKTQDDGVAPLAGAKLIARDRIRPDPEQPRRHFDAAELQALAASLFADGMQSPITAYYEDEDDIFTIITGERRWRAAAIAGLDRIPVLVGPQPANRAETLGRQLAENLLRADLTELEKAQALFRLRELQPQSWFELARRHGLSDRRVYQMLKLLDAPEPLKAAIQEKQITGRHARAIARLPEALQMEVLSQVIRDTLSVRATEEIVRVLLDEPERTEPEEPGAREQEDDEIPPPVQPALGPTAGAVAAVLDAPARQRQVRRFVGRVEAMETQLRNLKVGELVPRLPELPEYVQRMRDLRDALDGYIGFLERVQLDAPGEMQLPR